jgi:hypothetical protein
MSSCTEVIKESQKVLKETQKPIVEGKFFPLETEGIKMYLPKEFKKLSKSEYLEFVEKSTDTLAVNLEKERLRELARSQSKVYFFQHTSSNSILTVFPTEYINYLVISHKNKKSLIYFKDFTTVQDSIFSYEALDFLTFISSTKDIVYIFNPSFGELRYGLSKATNFKLLKQIWNSENIYEYTSNGISFDYEHGSAIVTTDGQLKYLKKEPEYFCPRMHLRIIKHSYKD